MTELAEAVVVNKLDGAMGPGLSINDFRRLELNALGHLDSYLVR
jgi:hypothetical protein